MTDRDQLEQLLKDSIEIQTAILKLLAYPHVEGEATKNKKAIKLSKDFGLSVDVLAEITGARSDNLRSALKREGLL